MIYDRPLPDVLVILFMSVFLTMVLASVVLRFNDKSNKPPEPKPKLKLKKRRELP